MSDGYYNQQNPQQQYPQYGSPAPSQGYAPPASGYDQSYQSPSPYQQGQQYQQGPYSAPGQQQGGAATGYYGDTTQSQG